MRSAKRWAFLLLGGYFLLASMIYFIQEKFIFLPSKLADSYEYQFDVPFEELYLNSKDGAKLNAIHFKCQDPEGVILYFHGNAGNLARWGEITQSFTMFNYDVVVMDYRSYGKSKGRLSETALYDDGQLFYDYVSGQYREEEIVLYGRSLGTGIATRLAAHNNPGKIILETPYYSLIDIGQKKFPYLPVKWLLKYEFNSYEYVQNISCPIVVFHGSNDEVIPLESGKKLFESIPNTDKEFYLIPGGRHNNLASFEAYLSGISKVLSTARIE